jgi:hypothetical protein
MAKKKRRVKKMQHPQSTRQGYSTLGGVASDCKPANEKQSALENLCDQIGNCNGRLYHELNRLQSIIDKTFGPQPEKGGGSEASSPQPPGSLNSLQSAISYNNYLIDAIGARISRLTEL